MARYKYKNSDPYNRARTPELSAALPVKPAAVQAVTEWEEGRNSSAVPHGAREVRTPSGFINLAATTPTLLMTQNARRRFAVVTNAGNVAIYVHFRTPGADVAEGGIYLSASGGAVWFGLATDFPYTGPVTVYSTDNVEVTFMEN